MRRFLGILILLFAGCVQAAPPVAVPVWPLDDRADLQRQIEGWGRGGGGVVQIDQAHQLDGPLLIRADRITLRGDGKLVNKAPYVGPLVVIGPATADRITPDHYPHSILDASAAPGRVGLATGGTHSVVFGPDGLTLGCGGGGLPGYYSDLDALTFEVCIAVPPGVTLPAWTALLGSSDGTSPDPVNLCVADDPRTWAFAYTVSAGVQLVKFPADPTIPHRLAFQRSATTGRADVWDNGRRVASATIAAGSPLRRVTGLSPFGVGFANSAAPLQQPVANLILYGLKVSAGARYDPTRDVQSFSDGRSVNDYSSYLHELPGDPPLIAYLPMTGPGPAAGTEPIAYPNGVGVGLWCPSARSGVPVGLAIEGLTLEGHVGPPVVLGEYMYARLRGLTIRGGLQAVGSVMVSAAERYTLSIADCTVGGYDSVFSLTNTIYSTERTNVSSSGITAVRESGCTSSHRTFFHPTSSSYQDTFFELHNGLTRLQDVIVDNENGGPNGAYIRCFQGWGQPSRLVVDGLDVSLGSVPLLELVGLGPPGAGGWTRTQIDVRNLSVFGGAGASPVVLRAGGPDGFAGSFSLGGVPWGTMQGTSSVKLVP